MADMNVARLAWDFWGLAKVDGGLIVLIDDSGVVLGEANGLQEVTVVGNPFATAG